MLIETLHSGFLANYMVNFGKYMQQLRTQLHQYSSKILFNRKLVVATGMAALTANSIERKKQNGITPASKELTEEINNFASKMGISYPVEVYTSPTEGSGMFGFHSPFTSAKIILHNDEVNCKFTQAHELSHVKHNDWIMSSYVFPMLSIFTITNCFSRIPIKYGPIFILMNFAYGTWSEQRADYDAMKHCKTHEIARFYNYLSNNVEQAKYLKRNAEGLTEQFFANLKFTNSGNIRFIAKFPLFDIHPTHTRRMAYLAEHALAKNNVSPIELYWQNGDSEPIYRYHLTDTHQKEIWNVIRKSIKAETLMGLSQANIKLFSDGIQVDLYLEGQGQPFSFFYENETFDFSKENPLLDIIKDVVLQPPLRFATILTDEKSIAILSKESDETRNQLIEFLCPYNIIPGQTKVYAVKILKNNDIAFVIKGIAGKNKNPCPHGLVHDKPKSLKIEHINVRRI